MLSHPSAFGALLLPSCRCGFCRLFIAIAILGKSTHPPLPELCLPAPHVEHRHNFGSGSDFPIWTPCTTLHDVCEEGGCHIVKVFEVDIREERRYGSVPLPTSGSFALRTSISQQTVKLASGHQMPLVGFGLWKVPKDTAADTVYNAIRSGYRPSHGAYDYQNEMEAGEGIKRAISEGLVKREDIFITTKLWNNYHAKEHALPMIKAQNESFLGARIRRSFVDPLPFRARVCRSRGEAVSRVVVGRW